MTTLYDVMESPELDPIYDRSTLIGEEGLDIGWFVCPSPRGQWVAWDDADPADPGYETFATREEAISFHHAGYRDAYPHQFEGIEWIAVNQIHEYPLKPPAIRWRIRNGKWPMGHARWRSDPGTGIYARWEVTKQSLE